MSILKKLKRANKEKPARVSEVTRIVAMVNKLIEMKLVELGTDTCEVTIQPVLWEGKDLKFKNNSCKNVISAWFVMRGKTYSNTQELTVFAWGEDEQKKYVGTYSIKGGLMDADGPEALYGASHNDIAASIGMTTGDDMSIGIGATVKRKVARHD
jgi:vancomycin resistance protein YoaR